jgi:hypothetical protein
MASELKKLYGVATEEFGVIGRVKLALLTKISSEKAGSVPDSPDNVILFKQALTKMRAEAKAR